jgi:predicted acyltransferase
MVLVNNPGDSSFVHPPLRHADWNGWTLADLVFPCFLFVMGTAMALSFARRGQRRDLTDFHQVLRRGLILFGAGLAVNAAVAGGLNHLGDFRVMGVLQRIGLTYVLASALVLTLTPRRQKVVGAAILAGYWAALALLPVPGLGVAAMTPVHSLPGWIDTAVLGTRHLYGHGAYDPEGLLSTLPAVVTVLLGFWAGEWLRTRSCTNGTVARLLAAGALLVAAGLAWGAVLPINKRMWTSSFVLTTAGFALAALAVCFWVCEVRGWARVGRPFEILGLNAIVAYMASEAGGALLTRGIGPGGGSLRTYLFGLAAPWAGRPNASLLFGLGVLLCWWLALYAMYWRRWFLKIS